MTNISQLKTDLNVKGFELLNTAAASHILGGCGRKKSKKSRKSKKSCKSKNTRKSFKSLKTRGYGWGCCVCFTNS